MKKFYSLILIILLSITLFPSNIAHAGNASIQIYTIDSAGKTLTNIPLSCYQIQDAITGQLPPRPQYTSLTSGASGVGIYSVTAQSNFTYKCTPATGVWFENGKCYSSPAGEAATRLAAGQTHVLQYTFSVVSNSFCAGLPGYVNPTASPTKVPQVTATPTPTSTPKPTPTPLSIKLQDIFLQNNSSSSDLSKFTNLDQLKSVQNFTLEIPNLNKITFDGNIDISSIEEINSLDQFILLNEKGKVSVDSKKYSNLDHPATITMYNLNFTQTPKILKDGGDSSTDVSDINYDSKTGTLTFKVKNPTSYTLVSNDPTATVKSPDYIIQITIGIIICWVLGTVIILGMLIFLAKRQKKKREGLSKSEESKS